MWVEEWLEHMCFLKIGQLGVNATKGNNVELQKLSREQKNI
jgi:hypothetical protein